MSYRIPSREEALYATSSRNSVLPLVLVDPTLSFTPTTTVAKPSLKLLWESTIPVHQISERCLTQALALSMVHLPHWEISRDESNLTPRSILLQELWCTHLGDESFASSPYLSDHLGCWLSIPLTRLPFSQFEASHLEELLQLSSQTDSFRNCICTHQAVVNIKRIKCDT